MKDLRVFENTEALAQAGCDLFFRKLESSLRDHGIFTVVLSGGSTPKLMHKQIAKNAPKDTPWEKVHFFWSDERYVPAEDSQSNFRMAQETLLSKIAVPAENIHRFPTELATPRKVAQAYERTLRSFFIDLKQPRFDLLFLGLGPDGHTASIFTPDDPAAHETAPPAAWVTSVHNERQKVPDRITLTLSAINAASEIVFLVGGAEKSAVLHEIITQPQNDKPASLISPTHGKLLWLADQKAARLIDTTQLSQPTTTLQRIANQLRIHSIRATTAATSGHPTSCCSAADLVAALFFSKMKFDPKNPHAPANDRFILSKGHAAPLLYAAWAETGHFDPSLLEGLRKLGSPLDGHPTPKLDFVDVATGSLGQGLSAGLGMAEHAHIAGLPFTTYVLMGDGELAEGSVWEAASLAGTRRRANLCAILDINRLGQSQATAFGHHVEVYRARFEAFGWRTIVIDGHSMEQILGALESVGQGDQPYVIVAETIKGKGIPFAEDQLNWHGKALSKTQAQEVIELLTPQAQSAEGWKPQIPSAKSASASALPDWQTMSATPLKYAVGDSISTRKAAGNALARIGEVDTQIIVLDGDVENSTYTETFGKKCPERFIECYIAEQNMLGVSVGLSAMGRTAFSSTFAAFYSRAYDQVRMAAISLANIKMIGTHAGISIGEDGPSQMALEDIASMRAVASSHVLYPCDAVSTERCVEIMAQTRGIFYLRTSRPDTPVIYAADEKFALGGAKILKQTGQDVLTVVTAGITVFEALQARETLAQLGIPFTLIDAYSVKPLASELILEASRTTLNPLLILTVEDHYAEGGLGDTVAGELSPAGARVHKLAVREIPKSGTKEELLARHGIDAQAIIQKVQALHAQTRDPSAPGLSPLGRNVVLEETSPRVLARK